jgi:hypothetical protein
MQFDCPAPHDSAPHAVIISKRKRENLTSSQQSRNQDSLSALPGWDVVVAGFRRLHPALDVLRAEKSLYEKGILARSTPIAPNFVQVRVRICCEVVVLMNPWSAISPARSAPMSSYRPLLLVPALALIAGVSLPAAEIPAPEIVGTGSGVVDMSPGRIQGGGRSVFIQGLINLDAVQQGNYTDGNDDRSDHRSEGWYRTELGTRIKMDDRVEVQVTVAGQGVMGNSRATSDGSIYGNSTTNDPANGDSGNVVIDDAFIRLNDFLNYRELGVVAGRMMVSWNLRKDHSAFLYDSQANYPTVTSWDGLRATYNLDTVNISPYVYRLPDNSQLYGAALDWEPAKYGDDRLFFTLSANLERNVTLGSTTGDSLQTYYVGADADLDSFELFGEFALQKGNETDDIKFKGWAFSGGIDWHADNFVLGLQVDYLTGDEDPSDNENNAFINNWEAVSDTYIVENEKYGELSRLLTGNLKAYKGKAEIALDDKKFVRVKSVFAVYQTQESLGASGSKDFGQEVDLQLAWDYTRNATITLFGAIFKPDDGYEAVSPAGSDAKDDPIYLMGANLNVRF